jgi:hypothetical protein
MKYLVTVTFFAILIGFLGLSFFSIFIDSGVLLLSLTGICAFAGAFFAYNSVRNEELEFTKLKDKELANKAMQAEQKRNREEKLAVQLETARRKKLEDKMNEEKASQPIKELINKIPIGEWQISNEFPSTFTEVAANVKTCYNAYDRSGKIYSLVYYLIRADESLFSIYELYIDGNKALFSSFANSDKNRNFSVYGVTWLKDLFIKIGKFKVH